MVLKTSKKGSYAMRKGMVWFWIVLAVLWVCSDGLAEGEKKNDSVVVISPPSLTKSNAPEEVFSKGLETESEQKEQRRQAFIEQLGIRAEQLKFELASIATPEAQQQRIADYRADTASRIQEFINSEKAAEKTK